MYGEEIVVSGSLFFSRERGEGNPKNSLFFSPPLVSLSILSSLLRPPLVGSLTISPVNPTVTTRGGPVQLTITAYPTSTITWTSSNPAQVTVDSTGLLTAVGNGPSVITATLADGRTITTTATGVVNVASVTINAPVSTILNPAQTLQLTATVLPAK